MTNVNIQGDFNIPFYQERVDEYESGAKKVDGKIYVGNLTATNDGPVHGHKHLTFWSVTSEDSHKSTCTVKSEMQLITMMAQKCANQDLINTQEGQEALMKALTSGKESSITVQALSSPEAVA